MPEQTPPAPEETLPVDELDSSADGKSMLAKLVVLGFVATIVAVECLAVYLFLPSRTETAAMAGVELAGDSPPEGPLSPELIEEEELAPQVEVDLGEFSVTAYQPVSNTTLRIDFHLFGTVATEDETDFLAQLEGNVHRFRDQVIVTLRSSDITDLTDAGLGLIKRKILEKTNAMLGKRYLRAIIFSDFSFIEQ
jgi:flagellar FliL protein